MSWLGFLFSSDGRISRKSYWLAYIVPVMLISIAASIADAVMFSDNPRMAAARLLGWLVSLFFIWPAFAISAKRLHDRGLSGWWSAYVNLVLPCAVLFGAAYWYYTAKMKAPGASAPPIDPTTGLVVAGIVLVLILSWLYFTINIGFVRGQEGPNKYGEDPLPTPEDVRSDGAVTTVFAVIVIVCMLIVPMLAGASYWYYRTKMKPPSDAESPATDTMTPAPSDKIPPPPDSPFTPAPEQPAPQPEPATPPADAPAPGPNTGGG